MSVNMELLEVVYNFAKDNSRLHNQGTWMNTEHWGPDTNTDVVCSTKETPQAVADWVADNVCGSTGCIAGWASIFAGWCQTTTRFTWTTEDYEGNDIHHYEEIPSDEVVNPANGELSSMKEAAIVELGLTRTQAEALFHGDNSIEDIGLMVEALRVDPDNSLYNMTTASKGYASCQCELCTSEV